MLRLSSLIFVLLFSWGCLHQVEALPEARTVGVVLNNRIIGTAWVYKANIFVTNAHVCETGANFIKVKYKMYRILDKAQYPNVDTCILKTTYKSLYTAPIIQTNVSYGEKVTYVGYPDGLFGTHSGQINGLAQNELLPIRVFYSSMFVIGGASGSPVYNIHNELVGMIYATYIGPSARSGLFIPAKHIIKVLQLEGHY